MLIYNEHRWGFNTGEGHWLKDILIRDMSINFKIKNKTNL